MSVSDREQRIARVLRPLGSAPMSRQQAECAGQFLGLHWTSVYRLRAWAIAPVWLSEGPPGASGALAGLNPLLDAFRTP